MRVGLWGVSQKGAALSSIHSKRIKRVIKPRDYRHYSKRLCEWMLPECSRRRLLSWWKFKNESLTIIKAFKSFSNHCQINLFAWYGRKYRNNIIQRRNTRNTRLPRIAYTHIHTFNCAKQNLFRDTKSYIDRLYQRWKSKHEGNKQRN